jgi:hypothetical protein
MGHLILQVGMIFFKRSQISCSRCSNLGGLMTIGKILTGQRSSLLDWRLYQEAL